MFRFPHLRAGPAAVDGLDGIPSGERIISVYFAPGCQRWISSENTVSLAGFDIQKFPNELQPNLRHVISVQLAPLNREILVEYAKLRHC